MSGGGGGGDTTTVQKADPWSGAQPHLRAGMAEAQKLFNQGGPEFFPGQTYVNRDPLENLAQNQRLALAAGPMSGQVNALSGATMDMLRAPDVASNPYVAGMADTIQGRLNRNLMENQLPGIRGGALAAGQVGGSRQALAEGQAIGRTNEAYGDAMAQLYSDAYGKGLDQQYRGAATAPSTMQAMMMPSEMVANVGAYNRGEAELALQDQMARHEFNQNRPYSNLQNYMNIVQGNPWGSTSSSEMAGGSRGFNPGGAIGGAGLGYMGGTALAGGLGGFGAGASMGAALGPIGAIGGALLGGLLS